MIKDRTKTRLGREIEAALTSLNDQYAFFLFVEHEFFERLRSIVPVSAERFTTEVFSGNKYASKIRVRLRDLQTFGTVHRSATFGAYFTASYEIAASFTGQVLRALKDFSRRGLILPRQLREGPEQYYQRTLNAWKLDTPAVELIHTLSFTRHRRNSLVHLNKVPSQPYEELTLLAGGSLNSFWAKAGVGIDFNVPETKPLEERETLDLLKLLRIVIQRLDTHFASVIDEQGLVQAEAERLFGQQKGRINVERRIATLRWEIQRNYGMSPRENDLRRAAQSVGST